MHVCIINYLWYQHRIYIDNTQIIPHQPFILTDICVDEYQHFSLILAIQSKASFSRTNNLKRDNLITGTKNTDVYIKFKRPSNFDESHKSLERLGTGEGMVVKKDHPGAI